MERLAALRRASNPTLRMYRTYRPAAGLVTRWMREAQAVRVHLGKRVPQLCGPLGRTNPRGGIVVTLVGPDGSGKSRLATELAKWLGWKVDARAMYFGSGEGNSSLLRRPLKKLQLFAKERGWYAGHSLPRGTAPSAKPKATRTRTRILRRVARSFESSARVAWAMLLASEKRGRLMRAWRARNRGITVICDRYPQSQVAGFNDGPLLDRWHRSPRPLLRAMAEWESSPYRWALANPPDVVIKLVVSPAVAIARKPDMSLEEIQRRRHAVASLRFPRSTRVVEVDADRPWEQVLLECKRELWDAL
jgi:thymidylate kinase